MDINLLGFIANVLGTMMMDSLNHFVSDREIIKLVRTKGYSESLSVKLGVSYGN